MRRDHRPYSIKQLHRRFEAWWTDHFLRPQFDALGANPMVMNPWHVKVHGRNIRVGQAPHIITSADRKVRLTTWAFEAHEGAIDIGDYVLLCPGVRVDSANQVTIGTGCMFAANVYVTDADWHDVYDRNQIVGRNAPVTLADNVWLGDSTIVCKGVSIGTNTVVGAGSVVTKDLPPNVIAAGNPAVVVRELDPTQTIRTRAEMLADPVAMQARDREIERYALGGNTAFGWLRNLIAPREGD